MNNSLTIRVHTNLTKLYVYSNFCQKDNATEITATKMEIDNNSIKYSEN